MMGEIAESSLTKDLGTVRLDANYGFTSEFTCGKSTPFADLFHDCRHEDASFDVEAGSLMLWNGLVEIATDIGRLMTIEAWSRGRRCGTFPLALCLISARLCVFGFPGEWAPRQRTQSWVWEELLSRISHLSRSIKHTALDAEVPTRFLGDVPRFLHDDMFSDADATQC